jgi:hypothetical protein
LRPENFRPSDHRTVCSWKGTASYHDVFVGDEVNANAAWYYPEPKDAAAQIRVMWRSGAGSKSSFEAGARRRPLLCRSVFRAAAALCRTPSSNR